MSLTWTGPAFSATINVYTTDYIRDLNPLNEETYALQWVSDLFAYKLFRPMCRSKGGSVEMASECIHHSERMRQGVINFNLPHHNRMHYCRFKRGSNDLSDRIFLSQAIDYTIAQINKNTANSYYGNRFEYRDAENPEIILKVPQSMDENGARYLDFPLLKKGNDLTGRPVDLSSKISTQDFESVNSVVFGKFKLTEATPHFLKLRLRGNFNSYCRKQSCNQHAQTRVTGIDLKSRPFLRDTINTAIRNRNGANIGSKPHIILNMNAIEMSSMPDMRARDSLYISAFSPKGAGHYFLGFNYRLKGAKGDLINDHVFRDYLAQSIWGTAVLRKKMIGLGQRSEGQTALKGEWYGQTLRGLYPSAVNRLTPPQLDQRIQQYLVENRSRLRGGITLDLLLTPEALRLFSSENIAQIKAELIEKWKCRDQQKCSPGNFFKSVAIRFRMQKVQSHDAAIERLGKGRFDLVIDRLVHGGRLGPIVDFLTPGHEANILGLSDKHIDRQKLKEWQSGRDAPAAYRQINKWLRRHYFIVSLGQLSIRDVYYRPMIQPAQDLYCGKFGKLQLPYGVLKWKVPTASPARRLQ